MNQKYFAGFYLNEMGEEICLCFDATAENLASFICQYSEYSHSFVTTLNGQLFLSASYGVIEICEHQKYLAEKLYPVLLPMELGEIPIPELHEIPKRDLECYDEPVPDWSVKS